MNIEEHSIDQGKELSKDNVLLFSAVDILGVLIAIQFNRIDMIDSEALKNTLFDIVSVYTGEEELPVEIKYDVDKSQLN